MTVLVVQRRAAVTCPITFQICHNVIGMKVKGLRKKSSLKGSQLQESEKLELRELETEQVRRVLRTYLAVDRYAMK